MSTDILTYSQQLVFNALNENCFPFRESKNVMWTTVALGKAIGCRSNNVERTLHRISKRLGGKLRIQRALPDSRNKPQPLSTDEIREFKLGGRKRKSFKAKDHPLEGKSVWLHIWLEV